MKLLVLLKTFLAAFLSFVFKPIAFIFKVVFLKIFAKTYLAYFSFAKKIGWNRLRENFFSFVFSRKTVHIFVAVIVITVSFSGLMSRESGAKTLYDNVNKTMISGLITSEFSASEDGGLVEEVAGSNFTPSSEAEYLDNLAVAAGKMKIATGTDSIDGDLLADLGPQNDDMIVKPEVATTAKSKKTRKAAIEYIVQPGDVIGLIADNFDISVNTILWENNLTAYSLIRPGDKLIILPTTGITYKVGKGESLGAIANKYNVAAEDILAANNLSDDAALSVGQSLFVPGGQKIYAPAPVTKVAATYNPVQVIKDLLKPSSEAISSAKMLWPTVGHTITQYFSWRHGGLDIANKQGTPVYAAADGVVVDAGWSTSGYGNKIDIDHGGGMVTRYGHSSKLLVKKGDVVEKGDIIMLMGTTGHSTGPHLHFEVRINGKVQNPLSYVR